MMNFRKHLSADRWENLKVKGARVQRPLWASTSTKNPNYPDTIYVDNLIGPETVNTVPPATLEAFRDHGVAEVTLTRDLDQAQEALEQLEAAGISMDVVTQELEDEGVKAFAEAFSQLLKTIDERRKNAVASLGPSGGFRFQTHRPARSGFRSRAPVEAMIPRYGQPIPRGRRRSASAGLARLRRRKRVPA